MSLFCLIFIPTIITQSAVLDWPKGKQNYPVILRHSLTEIYSTSFGFNWEETYDVDSLEIQCSRFENGRTWNDFNAASFENDHSIQVTITSTETRAIMVGLIPGALYRCRAISSLQGESFTYTTEEISLTTYRMFFVKL